MKVKYLTLVSIILSLTACSTTDKAKLEPDQFPRLNFVDFTRSLGIFTTVIAGGGFGFDEVGEFQSQYNFECDGQPIVIKFSTTVPKAEQLETRLVSLQKGDQFLKAAKLSDINDALEEAHVVGPVGLRCSPKTSKEAMQLTIQKAIPDMKTFVYDFAVLKETLEPKDFK